MQNTKQQSIRNILVFLTLAISIFGTIGITISYATAPTDGSADSNHSQDKTNPTAIVTYSTPTATNPYVTATIGSFSKKCTITNNNGLPYYVFKDNGAFTFTFVDVAGKVGSTTATVTNILKTAPTASISYSTTLSTNKSIVATLVKASTLITVTNNGGSTNYTFTDNGSFTFQFKDIFGNVGTATATVTNIDKKVPTATIIYSTTSPTNQNVVATLTGASETIKITNCNGLSKYTFTSNGTYKFTFTDAAGNIGYATATVSNIDKIKPTARAVYSSTSYSNKDVVVTLTGASEPITITNNNGSSIYTFTTNGKFVFNYSDSAGNTGSTTATVSNINKTIPTANITYSTTAPTNQNVTVSLTKKSTCIKILNNNGSSTYTFTQNGTFTFQFQDSAGNIGTATATVSNIDKVVPTATISYSTTAITTGNVVATLNNVSEPITITNNGGVTSYTFTQNGTFKFSFKDAAGNIGYATATVSNIDKNLLIGQVIYSTTAPTNQNVTATLTGTTRPVRITNNGGSAVYIFSENGTFTFTFVDAAGITGSAKALVDNIDKTNPTASIFYSNTGVTNQNVIATLEGESKNITITNNGGLKNFTFTQNGSFTFEFTDSVGNIGKTTATVNNIDKTKPTALIFYSNTGATNKDVIATLTGFSEDLTITNNIGTVNKILSDVLNDSPNTYIPIPYTANDGIILLTSMGVMNAKDGVKYSVWRLRNGTNNDVNSSFYAYGQTDIFNKTLTVPANTDLFVASPLIGTHIFAPIGYNQSTKAAGSQIFSYNYNITIPGGQSDSKTFTENGIFTFEYVDNAGNTGTTVASVNNIDRVIPTATVSYSEPDRANHSIIATLTGFSEEIKITNNAGMPTYKFTKNGDFVFEYIDNAGNTGTTTASVGNIVEIETLPAIITNVNPSNLNPNSFETLFITFNVNKSVDIKPRVSVGDKPATFYSQTDNTYTYSYVVNDYADIPTQISKLIKIDVTDNNGFLTVDNGSSINLNINNNSMIYESENMPGNVGKIIDDVDASGTRARMSEKGLQGGFLTFGPYTNDIITNKFYVAKFRLKTDNNTSTDVVATIDVTNTNGSSNRIVKNIKGTDFTANGVYQDFEIKFFRTDEGVMEYRVNVTGSEKIYSDKVTIVNYNDMKSETYESENLFGMVGVEEIDSTASNGKVVHAKVGTDVPGTLQFGPYATINLIKGGNYTAKFFLKVSDNTGNEPLGFIDVYDIASGYREVRELKPSDFDKTGIFQSFDIDFIRPATNTLEFRVVYYGTIDLWADKVDVVGQEVPQLPEYQSANLPGIVGKIVYDANSSNSLVRIAKGGIDKEGTMQFGPYDSTNLIDGLPYKATFRLKVGDNTSSDYIGLVDVYNGDTGYRKTLELRGSDFDRANEYQNFDINFIKPDGTKNMEYRIFFYGKTDLYADKVTISAGVNELGLPTYESERLQSKIGKITRDSTASNGKGINSDVGTYGWIQFGPYKVEGINIGEPYKANFRLKTSDNSLVDEICFLDVFDSRTGFLQRIGIKGTDFTSNDKFQEFSIDFTATEKEYLEFRVYATGKGNIFADKVYITK